MIEVCDNSTFTLETDMTTSIGMPKYKCHKEVWALKIAAAERFRNGSVKVMFDDDRYATRVLSPEWGSRFCPADSEGGYDDPGYYVQYEDGFESWSPSDVFEAGYTLIA